MRSQDKIHNVLTSAGCDPMPLADKEVWAWQQRWRCVFAKELHIATGKWVFNGFDWHVFSFGHHESRTSDAAWSEYRRLEPCSFLVLSAEDRNTFGFSCTGKPPDRLKAGIDILVTPTSLEWTMVFTHEEPMHGPYFAEP
jgi:hypothetical protein